MAGMDIEAVERLADEITIDHLALCEIWTRCYVQFLELDRTGPDREQYPQAWRCTHPSPTIAMPTFDLMDLHAKTLLAEAEGQDVAAVPDRPR